MIHRCLLDWISFSILIRIHCYEQWLVSPTLIVFFVGGGGVCIFKMEQERRLTISEMNNTSKTFNKWQVVIGYETRNVLLLITRMNMQYLIWYRPGWSRFQYICVCVFVSSHCIFHISQKKGNPFPTKGPQNTTSPNEMDHATWITLTPLASHSSLHSTTLGTEQNKLLYYSKCVLHLVNSRHLVLVSFWLSSVFQTTTNNNPSCDTLNAHTKPKPNWPLKTYLVFAGHSNRCNVMRWPMARN